MGAKNVEVIPNGVDVEKFRKSSFQKSLNPIRFANGAPPPTIFENDFCYIITVSRLVKKNAVSDIIEALRFLPENVKLLIVGDGPEKEKLELQVISYKFQDRVKFIGELSQNELPKYLATADIFVRPSLSEGLGNAFLEAMAAGLPVIGTKVGGIPDFLHDNETGLFCEVNNPQSIAEKVKLYLENDDLRGKIITNAQKLVLEKYDWNQISAKMEKILNSL
ncbi:MAG: glycosyl transferase, group 1 [Parcubacteria group bacterium Athens0714_24]|nr:MAG: glycosyl transferase, group 1 [Parcubacteria group bacterium Athens0714_24]